MGFGAMKQLSKFGRIDDYDDIYLTPRYATIFFAMSEKNIWIFFF